MQRVLRITQLLERLAVPPKLLYTCSFKIRYPYNFDPEYGNDYETKRYLI